jgi:hypothetical protein
MESQIINTLVFKMLKKIFNVGLMSVPTNPIIFQILLYTLLYTHTVRIVLSRRMRFAEGNVYVKIEINVFRSNLDIYLLTGSFSTISTCGSAMKSSGRQEERTT